MPKPPLSICLLLFSLSLVVGHLQNVPAYKEYLRMATASMYQRVANNNSSHVNFNHINSPFHDTEGNNYLEYLSPKKMSVKQTKDPLVLKKIQRFSKFDICGMVRPNVSLECCSSFQAIFTAASKKELWALQMIDAFGKPPSGIFEGNMFFVGSYDECLATNPINGSGVKEFDPKYCQINLPVKKTGFMMPFVAKYAICVPDMCLPNEINFIFHKGIHLLPIHIIPDNLTTYVTCPEVDDYDASAIFAITVSSLFVALLLAGTLYDIIFQQLELPQKFAAKEGSVKVNYNRQPSNEPNGDLEKKSPNSSKKEDLSWFENFLLCFSIYKNASKLFKTDLSAGSLSSLHGIRFISMTWVILGHTYAFGMAVWSNNKTSLNLMSRFTFQAVGNATVSVDTFFMISGLLVVYGVMHLMEANDGKMNWLYFYVHRYWRLTPPYMLVMMIYVPLFQYWGDGPFWPINGIEMNYCKDTWWYNLLYINNFNETECMAWSWYLANDMQFYIISPLILIFLYKKPKIGLGIISALMLAQLITCGVISKTEHLNGLLSPGYFNDIYVKPYNRIGSYLVGMLCGYVLVKTKRKMIFNSYLVALFWLFATVCALAVLYGLYDTYHGTVMSVDVMAFYTTINRIVWALSVSWVVYACVTGYGGFVNTILSWKPFIPLSRLTYCAYLVHPIIMDTFYLSSRFPIYLTDLEAIYLFFGHVVLSFAVGFVVSMSFEAPMIALESLVLGKNKNKK